MNRLHSKWLITSCVIAALALFSYACSKTDSAESPIPEGQQRVKIMLTDDPGLFDKVWIDIRKVEVLIDTCGNRNDGNWDDKDRCGWWEDMRGNPNSCKVWDTLPIQAGLYDLLTLQNGVDTSLAVGNVRKGYISQIRISLGDQNSLEKDGVSYPLTSVNGQSKILVKVRHQEWDQVSTDNLQLWLDFDVQRSIVQVKKGKFVLKPVIHVWTLKQTGSLSGKVLPKNSKSVITAYSATDSLYAIPDKNGFYKIRGLKAGTYSLFVNAGNDYRDTTLHDIEVKRGKDTNVPVITLVK
jgi:hypothetical protein